MTDAAPTVRVDRQWGNEIELYVTEQLLYRLADMIDALVLTGAIYSRMILPPDQMARKYQAAQQPPQGGQ